MFSINIATADELPEIVELVLDGMSRIDFSKFWQPEPQAVAEYIYDKWRNAPIFTAKVDDRIVGVLLTQLNHHWWTSNKFPVLMPYHTYVDEGYRPSRITTSLNKAVQAFAAKHELPMSLTHIANDRLDARRRMMRRDGFEEIGFILYYDGAKK